jgi:hypothetical protein
MSRRRDLVGQVFGRLTVVSGESKNGQMVWLCRCLCGGTTVTSARALENGKIVSCGCYRRENCRRASMTHGHAVGNGTPEYRSWCGMMARCYTPTVPKYNRYGGRGIVVCERWHTFSYFLADMGQRPSSDHSIERKDNNGPYSPDNCVWATPYVQAANRSNNRKVAAEHLAAVARRIGMKQATLAYRLNAGWSEADALTRPVVRAEHMITWQGQTKRLTAWASDCGVSYQTILYRLRSGWPLSEALTMRRGERNRR